MNSRSRAFPLADSLRAIAVLAIVALHSGIYAGALAETALTRPYLHRLESSVWAFFLISGLVLYRPWAAARLTGAPGPSARVFAWRRVLRIVPAYWAALVLTGLIVHGNDVFTARGLPTYFLFGQIYRADTASSGIPAAWTLNVEVAFYVFLPFWAALMRRMPGRTPDSRLRTELVALATLAAASVVFKAVVLWTGATGARSTALEPLLTALPAFLDVFAIGMALAAIHAARGSVPPPRGLSWIDARPGLAWLAAAGVLWIAAVPLALSDQPVDGWTHGEFMARHATNTAIGLLALLPLVFGDQTRGLLRRVLATPVLLWLGMVSYGIYLYHLLVLGKLGDWHLGDHVHVLHPYIVWFGLTLAGAALFASASWYGLERPLQRFRGAIAGRPDPSSREMAAAAHQPSPAAANAERAVV